MVSSLPKNMSSTSEKIHYFTLQDIDRIPHLNQMSADERLQMKAVANILPFRVNQHVLELIDWNQIPNDPIFRLTFPHPDMVPPESLARVIELLKQGASKQELQQVSNEIRKALNPHPAAQMEANVPVHEGHDGAHLQPGRHAQPLRLA